MFPMNKMYTSIKELVDGQFYFLVTKGDIKLT